MGIPAEVGHPAFSLGLFLRFFVSLRRLFGSQGERGLLLLIVKQDSTVGKAERDVVVGARMNTDHVWRHTRAVADLDIQHFLLV